MERNNRSQSGVRSGLLCKHGALELQWEGEEDIAKVIKEGRKQGLVEGNVRLLLLSKAACCRVSQSRDLISS